MNILTDARPRFASIADDTVVVDELLEVPRFFLYNTGMQPTTVLSSQRSGGCCRGGTTPYKINETTNTVVVGIVAAAAYCPWHMWARVHVSWLKNYIVQNGLSLSMERQSYTMLHEIYLDGFYTCDFYEIEFDEGIDDLPPMRALMLFGRGALILLRKCNYGGRDIACRRYAYASLTDCRRERETLTLSLQQSKSPFPHQRCHQQQKVDYTAAAGYYPFDDDILHIRPRSISGGDTSTHAAAVATDSNKEEDRAALGHIYENLMTITIRRDRRTPK